MSALSKFSSQEPFFNRLKNDFLSINTSQRVRYLIDKKFRYVLQNRDLTIISNNCIDGFYTRILDCGTIRPPLACNLRSLTLFGFAKF